MNEAESSKWISIRFRFMKMVDGANSDRLDTWFSVNSLSDGFSAEASDIAHKRAIVGEIGALNWRWHAGVQGGKRKLVTPWNMSTRQPLGRTLTQLRSVDG